MNRFVLLPVLALCLPLTARADDASLRAKAQQMVMVLHTDRMVQQVAANLTRQYSDAAEHTVGTNPTPDQAKQIADYEKKITQMIQAQLSWETIGPGFVDLYAKTFTEEELDAIIAFYKSPAGVAFLEKTPVLNSQITQLLQSKIGALQPQLRQSLDDFRKSQAVTPPASLPPTQPGVAPK